MFTGIDDPFDVISEARGNCIVDRMPLSLKDKVHFNPESPVEVTFGGDHTSGITERFADLIGIYNFIANEVLPRFDRFFP